MARATLTARRDAGGALWLVTVDVSTAQAGAYRAPGQYVQVRTPSGDGYFALASEPGASPFELLVRNSGEASAVLATAELPLDVEVEGPLGSGFPLDLARGRPLVIAVAGSAVAVARPLLRRRIADGEAGATYLFVGARAPVDLPLVDELEAWSQRAHVVLCVSRAELSHHPDVIPHAARTPGYVQDALARAASAAGAGEPALRAPRVPAGAVVFAAGPASMLADIRALGHAHGPAVLEVVTNA